MAEPLFGRVNPSPPTAEGLQTARCEHPAGGRKEEHSPNGEWVEDVFWSGIALSVLPLLCSLVYLHLSFFSSAVATGHMHFDKVQGSIHFQCETSQSRSDYEKVCLNSNTWAWLTSSPQGASKSKSHVPVFLHWKAKRNDHKRAGIKKTYKPNIASYNVSIKRENSRYLKSTNSSFSWENVTPVQILMGCYHRNVLI